MTPKKRSWLNRLFGSHNSPSESNDAPGPTHAGPSHLEPPHPGATHAGPPSAGPPSDIPSTDAPLSPSPVPPGHSPEAGPEDPPIPLRGLDPEASDALIRHIVRTLNELGYGANPTPEVVYYEKPQDIDNQVRHTGPAPGPYGGTLPAPELSEGNVMGLENIVKQAAQLRNFEEEMPPLVHEFVTGLVASLQTAENLQSIPDAEFYRLLRVRLTAIDLLPESLQLHAREFNPDSPVRPFSDALCIHLVQDSPHSVLGLSPASLEDRGPVEDLFRIGFRNLWQELIDSDLQVHSVNGEQGKPGERMWVFEGSSYYVGSVPILLDEIVERYLPSIDRSVGLLFASPHRHITLVREVDTGADLMGSIGLMATFAAEEFTQQAGALSPRLMISHMGEIITFTDVKWKDERSAELEVKPTAYLMEKLNQGWEDGEGPGGLAGPGAGPESS
ncbi:hypothetical protein [Corynebacterium auriscanis]|uniref:hypothetical protein n=1 Tax=Corynebacterium auriscanis TaxID=99807 RepID=UPI0024AE6EA7|nr:hypothetical protein [Corynebacterium auriscanis]